MIGLFDSGVGGLYALRELRARCPTADLLYFADTRNLPYGTREGWELMALGRRAITRLTSRGASVILSACGTISSVALPMLQNEFSLPLYGILEPTVEACRAVRGKEILLLGTQATVKAGLLSCMLERACGGSVTTLACPALVSMAERDVHGTAAVGEVLASVCNRRPTAVVLGCTHFSHFAEEIGLLFPHSRIIDSAREAARVLAATLPPAVLQGAGRCELLTSGDEGAFSQAAERILGDHFLMGRF
ncbi:MAG: glutamate racemase [Clostridia bacterium]|nr:glutamate racemase [Clostridia bacterium]